MSSDEKEDMEAGEAPELEGTEAAEIADQRSGEENQEVGKDEKDEDDDSDLDIDAAMQQSIENDSSIIKPEDDETQGEDKEGKPEELEDDGKTKNEDKPEDKETEDGNVDAESDEKNEEIANANEDTSEELPSSVENVQESERSDDIEGVKLGDNNATESTVDALEEQEVNESQTVDSDSESESESDESDVDDDDDEDEEDDNDDDTQEEDNKDADPNDDLVIPGLDPDALMADSRVADLVKESVQVSMDLWLAGNSPSEEEEALRRKEMEIQVSTKLKVVLQEYLEDAFEDWKDDHPDQDPTESDSWKKEQEEAINEFVETMKAEEMSRRSSVVSPISQPADEPVVESTGGDQATSPKETTETEESAPVTMRQNTVSGDPDAERRKRASLATIKDTMKAWFYKSGGRDAGKRKRKRYFLLTPGSTVVKYFAKPPVDDTKPERGMILIRETTKLSLESDTSFVIHNPDRLWIMRGNVQDVEEWHGTISKLVVALGGDPVFEGEAESEVKTVLEFYNPRHGKPAQESEKSDVEKKRPVPSGSVVQSKKEEKRIKKELRALEKEAKKTAKREQRRKEKEKKIAANSAMVDEEKKEKKEKERKKKVEGVEGGGNFKGHVHGGIRQGPGVGGFTETQLQVTQEAKDAIKKVKGSSENCVELKINMEEMTLELSASKTCKPVDAKTMGGLLHPEEPRYYFTVQGKIQVFIYCCPENSPRKPRMVYSTGKKSTVSIIKSMGYNISAVLEVDGPDDLEDEDMLPTAATIKKKRQDAQAAPPSNVVGVKKPEAVDPTTLQGSLSAFMSTQLGDENKSGVTQRKKIILAPEGSHAC
eukprot:m.95846 g.95846  ORF g.95846 m.95846 type:complete len:827 (+) comp13519_c0_seq1:188-2668(+)